MKFLIFKQNLSRDVPISSRFIQSTVSSCTESCFKACGWEVVLLLYIVLIICFYMVRNKNKQNMPGKLSS